MPGIYCLRVNKTVAGRSFPFDRVYLTRYEDREVLDQLFRYALVLPLEEKIKEQLLGLKIDRTKVHGFERDDDAVLQTATWEREISEGEWVLAVPVLPKWLSKSVPRYLTAEAWFDAKAGAAASKNARRRRRSRVGTNNPSPFTNRAYLQTPQKKIRPICVVCPRMILHQNGECELGEAICYESLPLSLANHFEEGLSVPEATPNELEPEEYQLTEGEEFVDEPVPVQSKRASELLKIIQE